MRTAFSVLAIGSSMALAFTCLAMSSLRYGDLEAADARAVAWAVASGSTGVALSSPGVLRGFFSASVLLAAASVASAGAAIALPVAPPPSRRRTSFPSCLSFAALQQAAAFLCFAVFSGGLALAVLAASARLASEAPAWCAPRASLRAAESLVSAALPAGDDGRASWWGDLWRGVGAGAARYGGSDPLGFSAPVDFVFDDAAGEAVELTGAEEGLGGGRGELDRFRFVDAKGRECFAVNRSLASFWRRALLLFALPCAVGLAVLLACAASCAESEFLSTSASSPAAATSTGSTDSGACFGRCKKRGAPGGFGSDGASGGDGGENPGIEDGGGGDDDAAADAAKAQERSRRWLEDYGGDGATSGSGGGALAGAAGDYRRRRKRRGAGGALGSPGGLARTALCLEGAQPRGAGLGSGLGMRLAPERLASKPPSHMASPHGSSSPPRSPSRASTATEDRASRSRWRRLPPSPSTGRSIGVGGGSGGGSESGGFGGDLLADLGALVSAPLWSISRVGLSFVALQVYHNIFTA